MADYQAYFNGEWMPEGEVMISPSDRGFTVGDLVFEVERTFNGVPFRLKEHIERLYRSLTYVRMDSGLSAEEMTSITEEAVERAKADHPEVRDFWMRQIVTRGTVDLFDPPDPTVLVQVGEQGFWYADLYDTGLHGVISKTRAYSPQALDPKIKHYSRMNFVLAHQEAHDVEPGSWPILLDDRGFLAEGNGQNVFVVTDGVIRTPTDYAALQGGLARDGNRPDAADRHLPRRGRPPAVRPLHGRRGVLDDDQHVRHADDAGRQASHRGRQARADVAASLGGMERGRRHRHRRSGAGKHERDRVIESAPSGSVRSDYEQPQRPSAPLTLSTIAA